MKALNIVGVVVAWVLSIALVVMLVAAPLLLSALSVLDTENIVDAVGKGLLNDRETAAASQQKGNLILKVSAAAQENALVDDVLKMLNLNDLEAITGQKIDGKVVESVLASNAMTDIFGAYANDIANALTGEAGAKQFTAEKLVELVQENMDEIVDAVKASGVTLSQSQEEEIRNKIGSAVQENADKIVEIFPDPEKITENLTGDSKIAEFSAMFFLKKNVIKGALVGVIVVLSLLIFFLRIPGFRGLRWLASNLFSAGGTNVVLCLSLVVGSSAIKGFSEKIGGTALDGVIGRLLSQLTTGVVIRTAIMLVAAVVLLVAYHLLKNKQFAKPAPAEEV